MSKQQYGRRATNLGEDGHVLGDLLERVGGKQALREYKHGLVLLLDTQLLHLLNNIDGLDATVLNGPSLENTVRAVRAIIVVVIVARRHSQVGHPSAELLHTSLDSLWRRIRRPILLRQRRVLRQHRRLRLDPLRELIVAARVIGAILAFTVGSTFDGRSTCRRALGVTALLILRLLGRVLDDVRRQLVPHVDIRPHATRFTVAHDHIAFEQNKIRLGILAAPAQHEFIDEAVQELAQTVGVMCAVNDIPVILLVHARLRAEFGTEELGRVSWRAGEGAGDVGHVG